LATHAHILTVTTHCIVGVTVQVYVPPNPLIVPFPIVTSHHVKLYTVSLHVAVTANPVFVHTPTADVKVGIGGFASIFIAYADACVPVLPAISCTNIHTYFPLFVGVLSVHVVVLFV